MRGRGGGRREKEGGGAMLARAPGLPRASPRKQRGRSAGGVRVLVPRHVLAASPMAAPGAVVLREGRGGAPGPEGGPAPRGRRVRRGGSRRGVGVGPGPAAGDGGVPRAESTERRAAG